MVSSLYILTGSSLFCKRTLNFFRYSFHCPSLSTLQMSACTKDWMHGLGNSWTSASLPYPCMRHLLSRRKAIITSPNHWCAQPITLGGARHLRSGGGASLPWGEKTVCQCTQLDKRGGFPPVCRECWEAGGRSPASSGWGFPPVPWVQKRGCAQLQLGCAHSRLGTPCVRAFAERGKLFGPLLFLQYICLPTVMNQ